MTIKPVRRSAPLLLTAVLSLGVASAQQAPPPNRPEQGGVLEGRPDAPARGAAQRGPQGAQPQAPRAPREAAPIDLTGQWVAVVTEDWRFRMVAPAKGDYASVPLTEAARAAADQWDPEQDRASGNACKAYGVGNLMRMPTRLRISWAADNALRIETDAGRQVRTLNFIAPGQPLDARQPPQGQRTLQGESRAQWERSNLKVVTTNMAPGYLRRNGIPYSENAIVTEEFYVFEALGETWLTVATTVVDPVNLRQPFLTSSNFKKERSEAGWNPTDCVSEWGPLRQMEFDPFD